MTITKFGQSCMLVEVDGVRLLVDPGSHSVAQVLDLMNLEVILITHTHGDHCDIPSIQTLIKNNPAATIFTNPEVQATLATEKIEAKILAEGESTAVKGVAIEAFGVNHIDIHSSLPPLQNVGFLIAGRLFHPGDSYTVPGKPVEILALPVGGPWCKIGEAIDYALAVRPQVAVPIHDGMFLEPTKAAKWPKQVLEPHGIAVRILESGVPTEF